MLAGFDDRSATAVCIFAYCAGAEAEPLLFVGECKVWIFASPLICYRVQGKIVPARWTGTDPFGWDPIFEPHEGGGLTYAEMDKGTKDSISHRGRALTKLKQFMDNVA